MNEKPVIAYSSKTWKLNTNQPMHAESGYWRPQIDGTIEVVIAQSTGLAEVQVLLENLFLTRTRGNIVYRIVILFHKFNKITILTLIRTLSYF